MSAGTTVRNHFNNPIDKIGRPLSGRTDLEIRYMALQLALSNSTPATGIKTLMRQADDYALYLVNGLEPEFKDEDSNLIMHAIKEMEIAGVDEDIYEDATSKAVLALMRVFAQQGHSGMSGSLVLHLFQELANFRNLTPLTDDPDEWHQHDSGTWQNKRNGSCFSTDRGKTYYNLDETLRTEEGLALRDENNEIIRTYHESVHVDPSEENGVETPIIYDNEPEEPTKENN